MTDLNERDEYKNHNLIASGAVLQLLLKAQAETTPLSLVEPVSTDDGEPTNQIDVRFTFLNSPYRLTIERIQDETATGA